MSDILTEQELRECCPDTMGTLDWLQARLREAEEALRSAADEASIDRARAIADRYFARWGGGA